MIPMTRYCYALDLVEDQKLIEEYLNYHKAVWPEIIKSIKDAGIEDMQIFRAGYRMFLIMDTNESFTFKRKELMDSSNPKVIEWEKLMWKYQKAIPTAKAGEKWVLMEQIFQL